MSRDILFPEGKMFLSFLVCPGVLPTTLEKLGRPLLLMFLFKKVCVVIGCKIVPRVEELIRSKYFRVAISV